MIKSLEDLAKSRGAYYEAFSFGEGPLSKGSTEQTPDTPLPPKPLPEFREEVRPWVGKPTSDPVACKTPRDEPVVHNDIHLPLPNGFSFFAGSVFLCIALLVFYAHSVDIFSVIRIKDAHPATDNIEYYLNFSNITVPVFVFCFTSVLACGYYLSWGMRVFKRMFRWIRHLRLNRKTV